MATIAVPSGKGWRIVVAAAVTLLLALAAFALDASPAFASGTVNVSVQGKGDVTGPGVNCNESGGPDCFELYVNERVCEVDPETGSNICYFQSPYVEFTAGSDRNGYVYDGWTNCDTVTDRVCGLTVTADRGVTARFRDAQGPSVTSLSPGSGVQRGTITLSAGASDNSGSVSRVEFRVRGVLVATDSSAPYSTSFNTASVSDGSATIRATTFDAAGNSSFTESTVTIDNTAPTVLTASPTGKRVSPTAKPTVFFSEKMDKASVEAKDAGGRPTTFVLKKGTTVVPATVAYTETTAGQYKAVLMPNKRLRSGATYTATVTTAATDAAGNALAVPKSWKFTIR